MVRESRYFKNSLADFNLGDTPLFDDRRGRLSAGLTVEVEAIYQKLLGILEKNLSGSSSDGSVYTGKAGIAYLYLALAEKENNRDFLIKGLLFAEQSLQRLRKRDVTFLCGDTGPLTVSAVLQHRSGDVDSARNYVSAVLEFLPRIVNTDSDIPDELLYGRVGYLYSLLFLNKNIPGSVPMSAIKQIVDAVIISGRNLSRYKKFPAPLLWEWYDELYVGGAHGIAGILYFLLQVRLPVFQIACAVLSSGQNNGLPPLIWTWHNKKYLGGAHGVAGILYLLLQVKEHLTAEQMILIRGTLDYLLTIRHPSGNFPSSIGSSDDRLVHWCHGAPGVVQLLLTAYRVWNDEKYLHAAEECGEVVWQRGLLRKGYGICHGVAGNAYTFLSLYQVTRAEKHLHRAVQFARWCDTYDRNQERPPDRPFSLFEGLAGTVYFLKDVQDPLNAIFPAYSLEAFK